MRNTAGAPSPRYSPTRSIELQEWREAVAEDVETQLSWSEAERERMRVELASLRRTAAG